MRIVMLTDDIQVDRRILLEAESLHREGHEIILLAEHAEGCRDFERLGNVKVERLRASGPSREELVVLKALNFVNRGIGFFSSLVQRGLSSLSRLSSAFFSLIIQAIQRIVGLFRSVVQRGLSLLSRISSVFFSLLIRANQRISVFFLRAIRHAKRLPPREQTMVERIVFYRADVIHAHDLPQLRAGAVAKKLLKVPLIYDAHELYPEIGTLTSDQKRALSRRERRYVRCADAVITVNKYIAEEMKKRYSIDLPHVILNATNWPTEPRLREHADRFREKFHIPLDHRIVLFQGWMSSQRGLQPMVKAMRMLPAEFHLVFMGYGEGRDELIRIAHEEGLTSRVHFMDAVPQSELLNWTSSADVGVIPYQPIDLNNYYCSPNKLFEFIQAELPIIANDLPFLRDVVMGEGFGLVHRLEEPSDYAAAVSRMFDGDTLTRCKDQLRSRSSEYSWDKEEKILIEVYSKLSIREDASPALQAP